MRKLHIVSINLAMNESFGKRYEAFCSYIRGLISENRCDIIMLSGCTSFKFRESRVSIETFITEMMTEYKMRSMWLPGSKNNKIMLFNKKVLVTGCKGLWPQYSENTQFVAYPCGGKYCNQVFEVSIVLAMNYYIDMRYSIEMKLVQIDAPENIMFSERFNSALANHYQNENNIILIDNLKVSSRFQQENTPIEKLVVYPEDPYVGKMRISEQNVFHVELTI